MILTTNKLRATFGRNQKIRTANFHKFLADLPLRKAILQAAAHQFIYP